MVDTSDSGIPIWESSDPPFIPPFSGMLAAELDLHFAELGGQFYEWANDGERTAQAGMRANARGYQSDNDTVYRYNGSGWKVWERSWRSYAVSVANFTSATVAATVSGRYAVHAGVMSVIVTGKLGTGTITVGAISCSTPLAMDTTGMYMNSTVLNSTTSFDDVSVGVAGFFTGAVRPSDPNTISVLRSAAANPGVLAVTSASQPFTWATLDQFSAAWDAPVA